jgi:hypothetical protein
MVFDKWCILLPLIGGFGQDQEFNLVWVCEICLPKKEKKEEKMSVLSQTEEGTLHKQRTLQ